MKAYTLTLKRLSALMATYLQASKVDETDARYPFVVNFVAWAWANKYTDVTKLPGYAESVARFAEMEKLVKAAAPKG